MAISRAIAQKMADKNASVIRRMFEAGAELKKRFGEDAVCDFSLGNPDLEPPDEVKQAIVSVAALEERGKHGYMPNAGYDFARRAMARKVSQEQGKAVTESHVVMTCGAAAALNCVLKAVLEPGDEVVVSAPFFPEYAHYAANHGGVLRIVGARDDFSLDARAIAAALSPKTAALIINSPNNPSGKVYTQGDIRAVADALAAHAQQCGRTPCLICDEPYRDIVYDGKTPAPVFGAYDETIIVSSFAKNLNLPGERVGYAAVNPAAHDSETLARAITFTNRILGFVNAPAFFQRVAALAWHSKADYSLYAARRDALMGALDDAGIAYAVPEGAFYLFCKVPPRSTGGTDDTAFCDCLKEHLVLCAPGSSFGCAGWFRMAFCVPAAVIENARKPLKKAVAAWGGIPSVRALALTKNTEGQREGGGDGQR